MKYLLIILFSFFSMTATAGVPQKITLVGKYVSLSKSIVVIKTDDGATLKVPQKSVVTKNAIGGDKITARVNLKDFLNLN